MIFFSLRLIALQIIFLLFLMSFSLLSCLLVQFRDIAWTLSFLVEAKKMKGKNKAICFQPRKCFLVVPFSKHFAIFYRAMLFLARDYARVILEKYSGIINFLSRTTEFFKNNNQLNLSDNLTVLKLSLFLLSPFPSFSFFQLHATKYLMKPWKSNKYVISLGIGKHLWSLLGDGGDGEKEKTADERTKRKKRNIIKMCPSQYDCWIRNYFASLVMPHISRVLENIYLRFLICIHNGFIRFDGFLFSRFSYLGRKKDWRVNCTMISERALNDFIHHLHLKQKATQSPSTWVVNVYTQRWCWLNATTRNINIHSHCCCCLFLEFSWAVHHHKWK